MDGEYFLALKKVNRVWLKKIKSKWQVLEIDTDKLNFADNPDDKQIMMDMVLGELRTQGWAV